MWSFIHIWTFEFLYVPHFILRMSFGTGQVCRGPWISRWGTSWAILTSMSWMNGPDFRQDREHGDYNLKFWFGIPESFAFLWQIKHMVSHVLIGWEKIIFTMKETRQQQPQVSGRQHYKIFYHENSCFHDYKKNVWIRMSVFNCRSCLSPPY